jgi:hypoxanthine phosphoribosyltransferase
MKTIKPDFESILISKDQIDARIKELATQIDKDYANKKPLFICILKGSIMFYTDLLRAITIDCSMDFMSLSSYRNSTTSGEVKMIKDLDDPIVGKDVIIVEDIVDSGKTLSYLKRLLQSRNPNSVKIITMLDKPERRVVDLQPDYTGFVIKDEFVVGYGLDYAQDYRHYPDIYILSRSVYEK